MPRLLLLTTAVLCLTLINGASIKDDVTKTVEELFKEVEDQIFKSLDEVIKIEKESGTLSQRDLSIIECVKFLKNIKDAKEESEKAINDTRVLVEDFKREAETMMEECIKTQTVQLCLVKETKAKLVLAKKLHDHSKKVEDLAEKIPASYKECKKLKDREPPNSGPSLNWAPARVEIFDRIGKDLGDLLPSLTITSFGAALGGTLAMIPNFVPFFVG